MKKAGTPKKVTYAQLERHLGHGKELLSRVTKQLTQRNREVEALQVQLQMAQAFIGILAQKEEVTEISKELLSDFVKSKAVSWKYTEDEQAIQIIVKEVELEKEITEETIEGETH